MIKKFTVILLIISLLSGYTAFAATDYEQTADFLLSAVPNATFGSVGGEWLVFGLARSYADVPEKYYDTYYENLCRKVTETEGILHERKYTEYARVVIALASINKNPKNVAGYDLTKPLYDVDKTVSQGINGATFALLALDCSDKDMTTEKTKYLDYILQHQLSDGGFSIGSTGEIDVTAMVLCALAKHRDYSGVNTAIEKGLDFISKSQDSDGGFSAYGVKTSESSAQVLVALCALGISDTDQRFVKSGKTVTDNLLSFRLENGGFLHTKDQKDANFMATEQAFYALTAKERFRKGDTSIFDMEASDLEVNNVEKSENSDKNILFPGKTFLDIDGIDEQKKIEALAERGIINGSDNLNFAPYATMTRAEFAAICVKTLKNPLVYADRFSDVSETDWYYPYVATAYDSGIIKGVSDEHFNPQGTITLSEAAVMVTRIAKNFGDVTDASGNEILFVLSQFEDYKAVPKWSETAFCYCYKNGILPDGAMEISPSRVVNRAEIASMLYEVLNRNGKL